EVIEDRGKTLGNDGAVVAGEHAAIAVGLSHHQRRYRDLVEKRLDRFLLGKFLGLLGRLFRIAGQQALIEAFLRRQYWLIAEQDVEEAQRRQVPSEHDEAH